MDLPPEEEDFAEEEEEDSNNQEGKSGVSDSGAKSLLPSETVDRQDSVEKWNMRNETEVIGEFNQVLGLSKLIFINFSVRP